MNVHALIKRSIRAAALTMLVGGMAMPASGQAPEARHALLIGGLGGNAEYARAFQQYLLESRKALVERFQVPAGNVTVLAAPGARDVDFVDGVSTADNIRAQFSALAERVSEEDQVYVFLFGHGSYDGEHAYLSIPRRDLSGADYAAFVDELDAGRVVFVNTASASAPFVQALSAPGRIVITATRTGTQRNATVFPKFWIEALNNAAAADRNKDGALSVREAFSYAAERTAQSFEDTGHLATERALLEDTGDGRARRAGALEGTDEGHLAEATYLKSHATTLAESSGATPQQLRERKTLRREIAELKGRKSQLSQKQYYAELETLFVRLARLNNAIEAQQR